MISLEIILAIVISLITINLLFIGFYIISVLRDVRRTIRKAEDVIGDVDKSVKDGMEKMNAMERPLEAIAVTTAAIGGVMRGAGAIKRATQSIMGTSSTPEPNDQEKAAEKLKEKKKKSTKKPKFFKKA